ncbi:MAG: hypothetical protein ACJA0U_003624 [Salibacteraceae bacterium]|jgi:hypothetical protein
MKKTLCLTAAKNQLALIKNALLIGSQKKAFAEMSNVLEKISA